MRAACDEARRGSRCICAPQKVERLESPVKSFARSKTGSAHRLRGRLRLAPPQLVAWATLSPGERKRWQIGAALAAEPDLLLLDEPTNHLDVDARDGLLEGRASYRGIGVVVSHDRTLLARLTEPTLRIHRGRATLYRGSYAQARASWEAAEREELSDYTRLKGERKKQTKSLADKRRAHGKARAIDEHRCRARRRPRRAARIA
jgi:ATPase subunit of ABC transporter with duplicated ATPase domains